MKRTLNNRILSAWDLLLITIDRFISTLHSRLSLSFQGCPPGKGFTTSGQCHFKAHMTGSIQIGRQVRLLAYWRTNRSGLTNPVLLETLKSGTIRIGAFSGASSAMISSRAEVIIGDHVNIGANVKIMDHDFHSLNHLIRRDSLADVNSAPIHIGDDVFIGTGTIILKGVTIGDRAIIGAGSIVSKSIPADEHWAGNPAHRIGVGDVSR